MVVVLLIPVANVLKDVPLTTLAAILIYVGARLFKPGDLRAIARFDLFEFGLTAVMLLTVVLDRGGTGHRRRRRARHLGPRPAERPPPAPCARAHPGDDQLGAALGGSSGGRGPGVLVLLFATPLWYANAVHFRDEVIGALPAPRARGCSSSTRSGCPTWTSPDRAH